MAFFRKLFLLLLAIFLVFAGLWVIVANDQTISLDLMFFATPHVNAGLAVLLSFVAGSLVGLLVGFNLFSLLRLSNRLYWLKREVRQLQDALGDKRYR